MNLLNPDAKGGWPTACIGLILPIILSKFTEMLDFCIVFTRDVRKLKLNGNNYLIMILNIEFSELLEAKPVVASINVPFVPSVSR